MSGKVLLGFMSLYGGMKRESIKDEKKGKQKQKDNQTMMIMMTMMMMMMMMMMMKQTEDNMPTFTLGSSLRSLTNLPTWSGCSFYGGGTKWRVHFSLVMGKWRTDDPMSLDFDTRNKVVLGKACVSFCVTRMCSRSCNTNVAYPLVLQCWGLCGIALFKSQLT